MEARYFVAVFIKILAVLVFLKALVESFYLWAGFASYDQFSGDRYYLVGSAIYFLGFMIVSILMWTFPIKISEKLLPLSVAKKTIDANIPYKSLLSLALAIIGFYMLASAMSDLVHNIVYIRQMNILTQGNSLENPDTAAMLAGTVAEIIIGIVLVFGSVGISKLVKRIRNFPQ